VQSAPLGSPTVPDTVLIADAGVAAVRTIRGLHRLGLKAVSVHTEADASALHATLADESVLLGPDLTSYRDPRKLVEAARQVHADAVHPVHANVPGLEQAVREAGLDWLGAPLRLPVELAIGDGVVEATLADHPVPVPAVAARAAEVVSGLDLTLAAVEGSSAGEARGGVAVSVDLVATTLAPVTAWRSPDLPDVWVDEAVEEGTDPVDPVLAVLTVWGADRDAAYALACAAWDELVIEGPDVHRPEALGGPEAHEGVVT
jgi:acetyl/propionyl-CoA carboxylase alpha subunit